LTGGRLRGGLLVLTVSAAAWLAWWSRGGAASLPTAGVRRAAFVDYLQLRGEIRPVRSIVVTAPSSGADMQIVELAVNGAIVKAGDVVAQLDVSAQQRQLDDARSEVNLAEADLRKVEVDAQQRVEAAEAELADARSAVASARLDVTAAELLPRIDAEKNLLDLASAERHAEALDEKLGAERDAAAADLAIARRKRDKARDDLAEIERVMASLTLRAPAAGSFTLLPNFRAGGPMNRTAPEFRRGDRVWFGAPIAELPDLTEIRMTGRIDEADRARIREGAPALVRVDALTDRELAASVEDIALVARPDFSSWPPVRNFDLVLAIEQSDPRLRSGMSATARIELERIADVLIVPTPALFQTAAGTVAHVVEGRSTSPRRVTVMRRGREETAILEGLQEGERVALRDPAAPEAE
jgi:multidrug efflux pump subunit AcrA (membrane-fusion protein)